MITWEWMHQSGYVWLGPWGTGLHWLCHTFCSPTLAGAQTHSPTQPNIQLNVLWEAGPWYQAAQGHILRPAYGVGGGAKSAALPICGTWPVTPPDQETWAVTLLSWRAQPLLTMGRSSTQRTKGRVDGNNSIDNTNIIDIRRACYSPAADARSFTAYVEYFLGQIISLTTKQVSTNSRRQELYQLSFLETVVWK